jgi:hypothetical protein
MLFVIGKEVRPKAYSQDIPRFADAAMAKMIVGQSES